MKELDFQGSTLLPCEQRWVQETVSQRLMTRCLRLVSISGCHGNTATSELVQFCTQWSTFYDMAVIFSRDTSVFMLVAGTLCRLAVDNRVNSGRSKNSVWWNWGKQQCHNSQFASVTFYWHEEDLFFTSAVMNHCYNWNKRITTPAFCLLGKVTEKSTFVVPTDTEGKYFGKIFRFLISSRVQNGFSHGEGKSLKSCQITSLNPGWRTKALRAHWELTKISSIELFVCDQNEDKKIVLGAAHGLWKWE